VSCLFKPGARIWLISPQHWDGLPVSKHHYARELAARGCRVSFIGPPGGARGIRRIATDVSGIECVHYGTWFPYRTKFHAPRLFDIAMRRQARLITSALGGPADLIWDFDNAGQFSDLRAFGAKQSLFHLVDAPSRPSVGTKHATRLAALHADFMAKSGARGAVSVIGHGLAPVHARGAQRRLRNGTTVTGGEVAMVGNLCAIWIDWPVILDMVRRFPTVTFRLIGPLPRLSPSPAFAALQNAPNCIFTGRLLPEQIAALGDKVAVWLIAFNDGVQGGPTDTHKMLEYLSTGAPILTSWLANWAENDLVTMAERGSNSAMPDMLGQLLTAPGSECLRKRRIETALAASYAARLDQIEALLAGPGS